MLQGQRRDLDGRGDVHGVPARRGHLAAKPHAVECREYLPEVVGGGYEELGTRGRPGRAHGDDPDGALRVAPGLGVHEEVRCVRLGLEAGGDVVPVPHVLGIVEKDHAGFEGHGGDVWLSISGIVKIHYRFVF